MQKAVIFGAGGMGVAIAYAMCRLGFDVQMVDPDKENATLRIKKRNVEASLLSSLDEVDLWAKPGNTGSPDIVISAAPYHQNHNIAKHCFERGWRYCDLGGDPKTSDKIHQSTRKKNVSFTDLGLAPGLGNIIAEAGYKKFSTEASVESVFIRVGGLPTEPKGSLNYGICWSCDGLFNELTGNCDVLEDGELTTRKALSEVEDVGRFEAFHTKGGLASTACLMFSRGVKNANYKTLRYHGHAALVRFLIEECKLTRKEFGKAMVNACERTDKDEVHIIVDIVTDRVNRNYIVVPHDAIWTAMQKCTAFPAAAVAAIMATGQLDGKGALNYSDVPIEQMAANLRKIGGFPECFEW